MEKISILHAIIMAIVQGLTEFLPISSSGHLVLFKFLLKADLGANSAFFEILLHIGTLIAVCCVYYKDVWSLIKEFVFLVRDVVLHFKDKKEIEIYPERKMLLLVLIASVPTAILGLIIEKTIADMFMSSVLAVGLALLVTSAILILSTKVPLGKKRLKGIKYSDALFIGFIQGIAVTPGISRSGSTIVGGLCAGLEKEFAIRFSFLISLPAIAGAMLLSLKDINGQDIAVNGGAYLLALIISAAVGYVCIRWMLQLLKKDKFIYFGYYCAVIGAVAVVTGLFM